MIVVDLIGRLGNQMFQYAFAVSTAKKYNTKFLLNPVYYQEINQWFELDLQTKFLLSFRFKKINTKILNYYIPKLPIKKQDGWENEFSSINDQHYEGFYQSEDYFKDQKNLILERFKIKKIWKEKFKLKYANIFSNSKTVVMHIRRTDYLNFGSDQLGGIGLCLPMTFYENCLNQINDLSEYKIFCISDDLDFVKQNFNHRNDITFVYNELIVDFQMLVNADVLILANSSFAWWGAYLNPKKEKIVYAPEFWLGFKIDEEYPKKIIPVEFIKVNVN